MLRALGSVLSRAFLLGGAAAWALSWGALAGCGSRTGFLAGEGVGGALGDDPTGIAGSGGSAGAGGLGFAGSSMVGAGGSVAMQPPPDIAEPPPDEELSGCANGGVFEGDVLILTADDFPQLEGCTEVRGSLTIRARVADLEPLRALREVRNTLRIRRGPQSFAGLENLRQVQELALDRIEAVSLQPFAGLERVRRLSITGDVPQGNLSGLGSIANLRELELNSSSLPTFSGLTVPPRMSSIVITRSSPVDLSALEGVSQLERGLDLSEVSGLVTLAAFSALSSVGGLSIRDNRDLVHIDGVANLSELDFLSITGNPRLEHLPSFAGLSFVNSVFILDNAVLRNVPRFDQAARIVTIMLQRNPALERVVFPSLASVDASSELNDAARDSVSFFTITENELLAEVSAPFLRTTHRLVIAQNPSLTAIVLPALEAVSDRLNVVVNPLLPGVSLGTLLTATTSQRKIGANQGDAPLASCPWTNDERCDEPQVCTAGSDLLDCSLESPAW